MSELSDWIGRDRDGVHEAFDDADLGELERTVRDCDKSGHYEALGLWVIQTLQPVCQEWLDNEPYRGCGTFEAYGMCNCSTGMPGPCYKSRRLADDDDPRY